MNNHFLFQLDLLYHTTGWTTAKLCFKISVQDFVRTWMLKIFCIQNRNVEGVSEKQHHESEDGVLSTLQR